MRRGSPRCGAWEDMDDAFNEASREMWWVVFLIEQELPQKSGVAVMSGKTDKVKGRIKEAAGALTGNDKLREEGKTDQAVGEAKEAFQKVADKVKNAVKKVIG